jgi:PKD repeat protein
LFQRDDYSWDPGFLWKTIDGGQTWNKLVLPPGYARRGLLACDAENEKRIWFAYPDGGDGEKLYTSFDGGESWENITTSSLNGEHITYIMHQGGTDGGLYIGTYRTIWFKDDTMTEWMPYEDGLPEQVATCILRPFYRDDKIRLGAYSKGIWEAPWAVPSRPVAQPMVSKRETSCPADTIHFDDYSMLSHEDAIWEWQFPGGNPSTSNLRNPKVIYHDAGSFDVTLTVTNPNGTSSKTVQSMINVLDPVINEVPPLIDFSSTDHFTIVNPDNGITWEPINLEHCDPAGDIAYFVNNYDYSGYGIDDILLPVNLDLTNVVDPKLNFNVAYAPYYDGGFFIDSLKVLLSNNCGTSFITLFKSGGEELSTTSSGEGPNNLYEQQPFSPQNCAEWKAVTLDLSSFVGQFVIIKFVNQSGYGNNMYLDDIFFETTLVSTDGSEEKTAISIQPNPTSGESIISGESNTDDPVQLSVVSPTGVEIMLKKIIPNGGNWQQNIDLRGFPNGIYGVKGAGKNGVTFTRKIVKQ